jgi:hypothetical protein
MRVIGWSFYTGQRNPVRLVMGRERLIKHDCRGLDHRNFDICSGVGFVVRSRILHRSGGIVVKTTSVEVFGLEFKYTVGDVETEFFFPTGDTKKFPNWDVKMVTERYYRSEYIDGPIEDHIRAEEGSVRGIAPSEVRRFLESQRSFLERLLSPMLDDLPEEEPLHKRYARKEKVHA